MRFYYLATVFLQTTEPVGVPSWVPWVIGIILLLLFWWGLNRNSIPQGEAAHAAEHDESHAADSHGDPHEPHHETEAAAVAEPEAMPSKSVALPEPEAEAPATPDDLKVVEGIGPKIEGILHEAGIRTFAELAAASVDQLEKIVREDAGIRVAFPDTWPEQARLAAAGEWDTLETLQEELKGGRRA